MSDAFWQQLDSEDSKAVLAFVFSNSYYEFDPEKVAVFEFPYSPYTQYKIFRFVYSRHWAQRKGQKFDKFLVPDGVYSTALLRRRGAGDDIPPVIWLSDKSADLYAVNDALGLKLDTDNVANYVTLFGQVVSGDSGSFNFLANSSQIPAPPPGKEAVYEKLKFAVDTMFHQDESGAYRLNIREKRYPLLGKALLLQMPHVYAGHLFKVDMRLSENGLIRMDDDEPTTIEGLAEYMPQRSCLALENTDPVKKFLASSRLKSGFPVILFGLTQLLEKSLGFLLMPVSLLVGWVLLAFGFSEVPVRDFFDLVSSSNTLNWAAFLVGSVMLIGTLLRFIVSELSSLTSNFVPHLFTSTSEQIADTLREARQKLGLPIFLIIIIGEHLLLPFQGLVLFSYGVGNIFTNHAFSLVDSLLFCALSVPVVPYVLTNYFSFSGEVGLYTIPQMPTLGWFVSIYISAIIVASMFSFIQYSFRKQ